VNAEARSDKSDQSDESHQPKPLQPHPPSAAAPKRPFAWQPLTPKGIATLAKATFGRVLVVQFVFALLAAAMVIWFLDRDWFPVITKAIKQMPENGEIRSGRLNWNGDSPTSLSENRFLALTVDLKHEGRARSPAHLAVELGERDVKIYSLLGHIEWRYPPGWWIGLNRTDATPWWGAWAPPILGIVALVIIIGLLLSWTILATLYAGPARLAGFFANRDMSLAASWRLCGAALMPGCMFLMAAIFIYGLGYLDLVQLGAAVTAHLVVGWIYIGLSIRKLPLHPDTAAAKNPFVPTA
jgi:hypothetical protein